MLLNHQYRVLLPVCGTWCDTTQTHLRDAHAGQGKPWADSVVLHGALKEQTQQATHSRPLTGTSAVQTPTHSSNHHGFLCRDICCCFLALRFSVLRAHRTRSAWRMCRCAQQLSGAQPRGQKRISGGKFLFRLIVSDRTMVFNFVIFLTLYKSYIHMTLLQAYLLVCLKWSYILMWLVPKIFPQNFQVLTGNTYIAWTMLLS